MDNTEKEWLQRPTILPPVLRQVEGTRFWEFAEEYRCSLPPPYFPLKMVWPVGWRYDRSSIPNFIPGFLINRDHLGCLAPAAHDAGYQCKGLFFDISEKSPYITSEDGESIMSVEVPRRDVDKWFLMYMLRQRVPAWRAYGAYHAVSGFWTMREVFGLSRRW